MCVCVCVFSAATKNSRNIITPNLLSFKSRSEWRRGGWYLLCIQMWNTLYSVSGSCCRWTHLRKLHLGSCRLQKKTGSDIARRHFIFLTFDVLIQSSLQGGNRQRGWRTHLTGWMDGDGYETDFMLSFPTVITKVSSGFRATMPTPTPTAWRTERVLLFKWRKRAWLHWDSNHKTSQYQRGH